MQALANDPPNHAQRARARDVKEVAINNLAIGIYDVRQDTLKWGEETRAAGVPWKIPTVRENTT